MKKTDPEMVLFSGAVGKAYHKLYEPFLSQKDELALLTNFKLETPKNIEVKSLKALLKDKFKDKKDLNDRLEKILENDLDAFDNFIKVLEKGLN